MWTLWGCCAAPRRERETADDHCRNRIERRRSPGATGHGVVRHPRADQRYAPAVNVAADTTTTPAEPTDPTDPTPRGADQTAVAQKPSLGRTGARVGGSPRHVRPAVGLAMLAVSATLFAVNGTMAKLLQREGPDAIQVATLRATGAAVALCVAALTLKPRSLRITLPELPLIAAYGLAGFFFVPVLYLTAISRMSVGVTLLLEYMCTLLIALWVRFVQRRQVRRRLWVGLGLSMVGMACVAQIWGGAQRLDTLGVVASLTAAVLLAAYFLLGARCSQKRDTLGFTAWAFVFAAAAGAVARPWWRFSIDIYLEPRVALLTAYVVIFGTTVPFFLIAAATRHLSATSVSIVSMAEVVLGAAVAWLALDEVLPTAQIAGGALILTGIVLAETARTAEPMDAGTPITG